MTGPKDPPLQRGSGRVLMFGGIALAVVAAAVLALGAQNSGLLRLGIIAALWAALFGAFAAVRMRREINAGADRADDMHTIYRMELDREIAARREHELTVERELREQIERRERDEITALRSELQSLRDTLRNLMGGDVMVERVALRAESTRLLPIPDPPVTVAESHGRTSTPAPAGAPRGLTGGPAPARGPGPDPGAMPQRADHPSRPPAAQPAVQPAAQPAARPAARPPAAPPAARPAATAAERPEPDIFTRTAAELAERPNPPERSWSPAVGTARGNSFVEQDPLGFVARPAPGGGRHSGSRYGNGAHGTGNGTHSNGAPSNGTPSNTHSNGTHSGTGHSAHSNGAHSNGAHSNGAHSNGAHSNGAHSNGAHSNGAHSNGAHSNGAHSNGNGAHRPAVPQAGPQQGAGRRRAPEAEPTAASGTGRPVSDLLAAYGDSSVPRHRRRRAED